jgi:3-hydroxyisobutyrate dehydrogenase/glyoxylate/succinic semialdehyde reductase
MKVGFIGLGIMGHAMANNLLKAGHELVIYNRTKDKAKDLILAGATWADSPRVAAEQVTTLFSMLATPEAVKEMALGADGFLAGLPRGSLWVDQSTVNPSFVKEMACSVAALGIRYVEAPVMGSRAPAETGQLTILAGGSPEDIAEVQPLLDLIGRKTIHLGAHGMAASMKLVVNMIMGASMLLFTEGFTLGEAQGISRDKLYEVLLDAPMVAPYIKGKKEKFESGDYSADFPLKHLQKDLHLAAVTAYENGTAMPMANAAKEIYRLAMRAGLADEDFSAVFGMLNRGNSND